MRWFEQLGAPARARERSPPDPREGVYSTGARGGPRRPAGLGDAGPQADALPQLELPPDPPPMATPPIADSPFSLLGAGTPPPAPTHPERTSLVSTNISATAEIAGFIGSCLVDSESGLMLASEGGGAIDMEAAAALNTQVIKAKLQAMQVLGLEDKIEDILITMGKQLHMIRPLERAPGVFLYVALDKKSANLGMARMQVKKIESTLSM